MNIEDLDSNLVLTFYYQNLRMLSAHL